MMAPTPMPMWDKALHEIPESEFQQRLENVRGFAV